MFGPSDRPPFGSLTDNSNNTSTKMKLNNFEPLKNPTFTPLFSSSF